MRAVLINSVILLFVWVSLFSACAPPVGIYHTVKPGQTLYRIAKTYGIEESRLAQINNINDPTQLKVNQRLYIPGISQPRKVPSTASTSASKSPRVTTASPATQKKPAVVARQPTVKKPAATKTTSTAKPVKGTFIWPAKGKLLNKFGKQDKNVYKGIEIGVPKGTSVVAAASGKVIYSGSAIAGYGNLVILEHSDSYFSVYGYNHKNLVKMDDYVGQGDKIALSGLPPNGQSARLHFEIRKGKSAVNPILYLP